MNSTVIDHLRAALDRFHGYADTLTVLDQGPAGQQGYERWQPQLEVRQLAIDEQAWVRDTLREPVPPELYSLLIGYWFLLVRVQVASDALFGSSPEVEDAAYRVGVSLGDILRLRLDIDAL
jgi:hypothetical protein